MVGGWLVSRKVLNSAARTKDAELVALRVGQDDPLALTLPDIDPSSSRSDQAVDFGGLVDRAEIRMPPVLAHLRLRDRHEQQTRQLVGCRPDLEFIIGFGHDDPAQSRGPPSSESNRIARVDDDLLPGQVHSSIMPAGTRCTARTCQPRVQE